MFCLPRVPDFGALLFQGHQTNLAADCLHVLPNSLQQSMASTDLRHLPTACLQVFPKFLQQYLPNPHGQTMATVCLHALPNFQQQCMLTDVLQHLPTICLLLLPSFPKQCTPHQHLQTLETVCLRELPSLENGNREGRGVRTFPVRFVRFVSCHYGGVQTPIPDGGFVRFATWCRNGGVRT